MVLASDGAQNFQAYMLRYAHADFMRTCMLHLMSSNSCLGVLDINGASKAYPAWTFAVHQQSKHNSAVHDDDDSSDYASEQSDAGCNDDSQLQAARASKSTSAAAAAAKGCARRIRKQRTVSALTEETAGGGDAPESDLTLTIEQQAAAVALKQQQQRKRRRQRRKRLLLLQQQQQQQQQARTVADQAAEAAAVTESAAPVTEGTETQVTAAATATGDAPTAIATTVAELPRPDWEGMTRVLDGFRGDMESKSELRVLCGSIKRRSKVRTSVLCAASYNCVLTAFVLKRTLASRANTTTQAPGTGKHWKFAQAPGTEGSVCEEFTIRGMQGVRAANTTAAAERPKQVCHDTVVVCNDPTQVRLDTAKLLKPDPPPKTPRTVGRPLTEWQVTHAFRQQQQRLSCSASLDGLDSFFSASMAMMSLDKQQTVAGDDWYNKDSSTTMARPHSLSDLKESRGASRREASR
eukprot:17309-Heterococcus_DN1.PRE.1